MKTIYTFILLGFVAMLCASCQKEPTTPSMESANLPPITVHTEACYSPDCMTLILAHPDDNFFFEDEALYLVDWWKDGAFLRQGTRLDCMHAGSYRAVVTFRLQQTTRELTYELKADDGF